MRCRRIELTGAANKLSGREREAEAEAQKPAAGEKSAGPIDSRLHPPARPAGSRKFARSEPLLPPQPHRPKRVPHSKPLEPGGAGFALVLRDWSTAVYSLLGASVAVGVVVPLAEGVSAALPAEGDGNARAVSTPPPFSSNASM